MQSTKRIKVNGYTHAKADARKAGRREEAEARNAAYAKLTLYQKAAKSAAWDREHV